MTPWELIPYLSISFRELSMGRLLISFPKRPCDFLKTCLEEKPPDVTWQTAMVCTTCCEKGPRKQHQGHLCWQRPLHRVARRPSLQTWWVFVLCPNHPSEWAVSELHTPVSTPVSAEGQAHPEQVTRPLLCSVSLALVATSLSGVSAGFLFFKQKKCSVILGAGTWFHW